MTKDSIDAYAIVRLDLFQRDPRRDEIVSYGSRCPWNAKIRVKRIIFDLDVAEAEVERLNSLVQGDVLYFWQYTRILRSDWLRMINENDHAAPEDPH